MNRDASLAVLGVVPKLLVAASGRDMMMEVGVGFQKTVCVEAESSESGVECRTQKLAADGGQKCRWVVVMLLEGRGLL